MKICIFNSFYPLAKGGAEYQARIIANEFKKEHDVFFISYHHKKNETINVDGYRVYCLKSPGLLDTLGLYFPIARRIKKILDVESPDVIYQRILNSFSFHIACYSCRKHINFLLHIADNYCLQFGFSIRAIVRWCFFTNIRHSYNKGITKFIVQTDYQQQLLSNLGISAKLKLRNMHSWTVKKNTAIISSNLPKEVVWIGSFRQVKQLELFLDIAQKNILNPNLVFVIIGRNENNEYSNKLLTRIRVQTNVNYLGELENDAVNQFIEHSYILINTSLSEGFSNTFIQAWLRGVPVISLNSDPDLFLSRHHLGIVACGDVERINEELNKFVENKNYYNDTSVRCRAKAIDEFSIDINIVKLKKIL